MSFRKDQKKLTQTNNRFSSLASDKDEGNTFKKVRQKSEKTKEKSRDKIPTNSRFKDLETKKNIFSKPQPRENSRWRREEHGKDEQNRKIHRHGDYDQRNRRSDFRNKREYTGNKGDRSQKKWSKDGRSSYRKRNTSEYNNRRDKGEINNFTKKPPAFNVEKENFPSLFQQSKTDESHDTNTDSVETTQYINQENKSKKQDDVKPMKIVSTRLNYFREIIGVSNEATKDEIKKAYHKLSLQYHPDKNSSTEAEEKFKKINEAYKILLQPTDFKSVIKNKKKKFTRAPSYSVEPGWVKMRLSKGKIIKIEGPKIQKIERPKNVSKIHRQIMAEMNERHNFNRELDGITLTDVLGEDAILSDDDEMNGYHSGSDNDGMMGVYDNDYY